MRLLAGITDSMDTNLSKLQEIVKDREVWHAAVHRLQRVAYNLATKKQQQNISKVNKIKRILIVLLLHV